MILFDILKSNQNNYKMKFLNFCFAGILGSVLLISITGSVTRGPLSSVATTTEPVPMCRDTSEHCAFWAAGNLCEDELYKNDLRDLCPVSCNHCETDLPVVCRNHHSQCFLYAFRGYCKIYPEFMHPSCPLACGIC